MKQSSSSLTDTLFKKFEDRIAAGEMVPGARFPTQKELSVSECVSRTVVREAVARLAAKGLVTSRQGSGVFVAKTANFRAFQVTSDEMGELSDVIKLLEMRLAVETEMAALAAARRTDADLARIADAIQRMAEAVPDSEEAALADRGFHLAIARATRNDYFVRLIDFLGIRLVPPRAIFLRGQPEEACAAYAAAVHGEHEAILRGIAERDPEQAREAARLHMQASLNRHTRLSESKRSRIVAG